THWLYSSEPYIKFTLSWLVVGIISNCKIIPSKVSSPDIADNSGIPGVPISVLLNIDDGPAIAFELARLTVLNSIPLSIVGANPRETPPVKEARASVEPITTGLYH